MRFVSVRILSPGQKVSRRGPRVCTLMIQCGNTSGGRRGVAVWLQREFQTECSRNARALGSVGWCGACGMRGLEEGGVEALSSTGKIVGLAPGVGSTGVGKAGGPSPLTFTSSATTAAGQGDVPPCGMCGLEEGRGDVTPPGAVRDGRGAARRPAWRRQARGGAFGGGPWGRGVPEGSSGRRNRTLSLVECLDAALRSDTMGPRKRSGFSNNKKDMRRGLSATP